MKFKLVLVPFPFDDLSANKVRPALCLTDPIGIHEHVILAFITSRISSTRLDSDLVIDPASSDLSATGLKVPSVIQLHRLMTVTKSFLLRELGELPLPLQQQAKDQLRLLFALDEPA